MREHTSTPRPFSLESHAGLAVTPPPPPLTQMSPPPIETCRLYIYTASRKRIKILPRALDPSLSRHVQTIRAHEYLSREICAGCTSTQPRLHEVPPPPPRPEPSLNGHAGDDRFARCPNKIYEVYNSESRTTQQCQKNDLDSIGCSYFHPGSTEPPSVQELNTYQVSYNTSHGAPQRITPNKHSQPLTAGISLRASAEALAKQDMNPSLMPCFFSKSSL